MALIYVLAVFGLLWLSLRQRVLKRKRCHAKAQAAGMPVEPEETFFSQAIRDLVAAAGGIYLGLRLLADFLKMDLPERVALGPIALDPAAGLAVLFALVQPFLFR